MKALISGTKIVQIADAEFPVHPDLRWVDVPNDTTTFDTFDGKVVKPPKTVLKTVFGLKQLTDLLISKNLISKDDVEKVK